MERGLCALCGCAFCLFGPASPPRGHVRAFRDRTHVPRAVGYAAGILACPPAAAFPVRSRVAPNQWPMWRAEIEWTYSSGTAQESHLFPLSACKCKGIAKIPLGRQPPQSLCRLPPRRLPDLLRKKVGQNPRHFAVHRTGDARRAYELRVSPVCPMHAARTAYANFKGVCADFIALKDL